MFSFWYEMEWVWEEGDFGNDANEEKAKKIESILRKSFRNMIVVECEKPTYMLSIQLSIVSCNSFIISTVCLLILYLVVWFFIVLWVLCFFPSSFFFVLVRSVVGYIHKFQLLAKSNCAPFVCARAQNALPSRWNLLGTGSHSPMYTKNCRNIIYNGWAKTGNKQVLTRR